MLWTRSLKLEALTIIYELPSRGIFSENSVPEYAASCMGIRPVLRMVAGPSEGSTYLAGSEGYILTRVERFRTAGAAVPFGRARIYAGKWISGKLPSRQFVNGRNPPP